MHRFFHGRLPLTALLVAMLASLACAPASSTYEGLPWIENDYAAAIAVAKEKDLPIFVESWAPW